MRRDGYEALIAVLAVSLAACATKQLPAVQQSHCAAAHFPVQLSMAGSLEDFAGQYWGQRGSVTLRQNGYAVLLADARGERELRKVNAWRFEDGCGVVYQLSLPLNGTGASLAIITPEGRSVKLHRVRRLPD